MSVRLSGVEDGRQRELTVAEVVAQSLNKVIITLPNLPQAPATLNNANAPFREQTGIRKLYTSFINTNSHKFMDIVFY